MRASIEFAIKKAQIDYDRDQWMRDVCRNGSDAELIAAGEKEYPDAPIGLSTWYPRVSIEQETVFARVARNGARRPVFMRGGLNVIIRRKCFTANGTSPNGWASEVFWRAVRIAKITALDRDDYQTATGAIYDALKSKYYLTSVFDRHVGRDVWGGPILIGGKPAFLNNDQLMHIRALARIASKAETLHQLREQVRQQLMERLAA